MPPIAKAQEVKVQEVGKEPVKLPIRNQATIQLRRPIKNLRRYIELIDQKDNLQKIEHELKRLLYKELPYSSKDKQGFIKLKG